MNSYQCHQILGVGNDVTFKEVKSAYRRLALQFHPDKNMSEIGGQKFKEITEAYQFLRAEYKRAIGSKAHSSQNTGSWDYQEKTSSKKHDFSGEQSWWGAKPTDKPPEEDWGRYTKETESAYQDFWRYYEKTFWEYYERAQGDAKVNDSEPLQEAVDVEVSVNVDHSRCIGCCSCETIAPTVFQVNKNVRVNPKSNVINQRGAKPEKILDAAETCPTKAISVTDADSKKQLYPW